MRQYFDAPLADPLIVPAVAVSPGTVATSLLTVAQANKYLPLPYGQNAPSPGSAFKVRIGGICVTVSGIVYFVMSHGPGVSPTAFGTPIAAEGAGTQTPVAASGNWLLDGILIYRSISEIAGQSTCWFQGFITINPISSPLVPVEHLVIQSGAAVSVDTTGNGASGTFGALNVSIIDSASGSSWTTEFAFIEQIN